MLLFVNLLVLFATLKLLEQTNKPLQPAIVYSIARFIFGLMFSGDLMMTIIATLISFVLAYVYFWLLNKTSGSILWWLILILGLAIGLV